MAARDDKDTPEIEDSGITAESNNRAGYSAAVDCSASQSATETPAGKLTKSARNGSVADLEGIVTGLDIFAGAVDAAGISSLVQDMQRNLLPNMDEWRRNIFGSFRSALPAVPSMQAVAGGAAFDAVRSVQSSGVTSLIETMQAQHALSIKQMLPTLNVLDSIVPALQELSAVAEMQRSIIASSAIQQVAARPVLDMSALLDILPSKTMLADILTTANLAKNLDLSSVLPEAFGFSSVRTAALAATAAQQAAAQVDEDEAEHAAVQAVLEAIGDELNPESPPIPAQLVALETVSRLLVAVRPQLAEHFTARGWLVGIATNGTLLAFVYLALAQPALLATLFTVASIATGTKWVYDKASGLLLPSDDDGN